MAVTAHSTQGASPLVRPRSCAGYARTSARSSSIACSVRGTRGSGSSQAVNGTPARAGIDGSGVLDNADSHDHIGENAPALPQVAGVASNAPTRSPSEA
jgi:hypothetical protein